jgi:hypothetical protein
MCVGVGVWVCVGGGGGTILNEPPEKYNTTRAWRYT